MSLYLPSKNVIVKNAEEALWALMGGHSSLHALIIGIDHFASPHIKDLHGAVHDADAIVAYIEQELRTPPAQIVNLRNEQATRKRIIRELCKLRSNHSIQRGDPILIYFAAHGTSSLAPSGWNAGTGKIQLIVPYDCHMPDPDASGKTIAPIPDRTLGALLDKLAQAEGKGDNITVIFDCCNSGSGTRISDYEQTRMPRGFLYEDPLPGSLDYDIWSEVPPDRAVAVAAGFAQAGSRSHVLLAACASNEIAQEEKGRGVFTTALLDVLKILGTTKITYRDLIAKLPDLPAQTPQCEGFNSSRVLFNARAPNAGRALYRVRQRGGGYILEAGSAHGITHDSLFDIYPTREFRLDDEPLGRLKSMTVDPFRTELAFISEGAIHFALPEYEGFALLTQAGQEEALRLHVPLKDGVQAVFEALAHELTNRQPGQRPILLVDKDKAELSVDLGSNGEILFDLTDGLITGYGLTRLYYSVPPDASMLYPVLQASAHFFWHLRRSPDKNLLRSKVDILFQRLEATGHLTDELDDIYEPKGPNLIRDGVVDLEADEQTKYGVTIINKIGVPMFVSLFFFDCSDLSITAYHLQPSSGPGSEPTLPANRDLPIGYGDGGGVPHQYFLRQGQDVDVGFLKLFLSTRPVDLDNVPQKTPFEDMDKSRNQTRQKKRETVPTWDALTIAMVQRKPGSKLQEAE
ncbi:caspase domain-containing protein [Vararia minispora EC-137]|uniref:Caspase domain-containing protein n=1 Tax=Vararia minispora EC-137 TaxID=1314806 RepID=A0ACB8QME2_9AGAM|nr:caspase domain-containing protein [Vararia minispora EC-137]